MALMHASITNFDTSNINITHVTSGDGAQERVKARVPLRFVIVLVGSRGDVQPYVALGVGLRAQGHTVRIAAHSCFRSLVERHGLEFAPLAGDPKELLKVCAYLCIHQYTCIYVSRYLCTYVYLHICVFVSIRVSSLKVFVCAYGSMHKQASEQHLN
jgi:hypothetical protein